VAEISPCQSGIALIRFSGVLVVMIFSLNHGMPIGIRHIRPPDVIIILLSGIYSSNSASG